MLEIFEHEIRRHIAEVQTHAAQAGNTNVPEDGDSEGERSAEEDTAATEPFGDATAYHG
jgi:hypothetical protein